MFPQRDISLIVKKQLLHVNILNNIDFFLIIIYILIQLKVFIYSSTHSECIAIGMLNTTIEVFTNNITLTTLTYIMYI